MPRTARTGGRGGPSNVGSTRAVAARVLITWAQARDLGCTPEEIRQRVSSGAWERIHLGVIRIAGAPPNYEQSLVAACLAIGAEAAASHRSAAVLHGLLGFQDPPVEVTTDRRRSPELAQVAVHRLADFTERWVTTVDGVRVTTAARTLVDLGAVCRRRLVETALDRAIGRRLVTLRDVRDALVSVARRGRRGVGVLRPLLDERLGVAAPAGVMEARMASLLQRAGLGGAIPEFMVTDDHGGFVAVVDFAFPDARLAIEVDGYEAHIPLAAFRDGMVQRSPAHRCGLVAAPLLVARGGSPGAQRSQQTSVVKSVVAVDPRVFLARWLLPYNTQRAEKPDEPERRRGCWRRSVRRWQDRRRRRRDHRRAPTCASRRRCASGSASIRVTPARSAPSRTRGSPDP